MILRFRILTSSYVKLFTGTIEKTFFESSWFTNLIKCLSDPEFKAEVKLYLKRNVYRKKRKRRNAIGILDVSSVVQYFQEQDKYIDLKFAEARGYLVKSNGPKHRSQKHVYIGVLPSLINFRKLSALQDCTAFVLLTANISPCCFSSLKMDARCIKCTSLSVNSLKQVFVPTWLHFNLR